MKNEPGKLGAFARQIADVWISDFTARPPPQLKTAPQERLPL
jgi:hypothetical protein